MSHIQTIGVVGAGQMGNGIAQVAAASGYQVILYDLFPEALDRGLSMVKRNLGRVAAKGRISEEDAALFLTRIRPESELAAMEGAEMVVEAAVEKAELKFKLFEDLSRICPPGTLLLTNTSSISITAIAAHTDRPHLVAGMHFMNPVPVMKLVEVIRGLATSQETYDTVVRVAASMGKTTVEGRDMPGFIVNRVLMPYINEAAYALYEGIGSADDIDASMKLGTNVPMGPLELADFIGLDTCLAIMQVLHDGMADTKYRPCPLLRKYVEAGWLGRKTGRGFHSYKRN